ncbi:MAG: cytochrome c [Longimicrobiales bacterium]|nr:cytochrome c [Longimicrobiales bacterium]
MRSLAALSSALCVAVVSAACGHEFHPPDRSERVAEAEAEYSPALFDSVTWTSQEARVQEGNAIYAEDCRVCHGPVGRGDTEYARERGLEVPSLVQADWPLDDIEALRHEIYVGHETGMPVFGEGGLSLFQMDAVAAYIVDVLRPEILGTGAPS